MRIAALIIMLLSPNVAWAEVMDKEFSLATVLACGLAGVLGCYAAARWFPWALAVVFPAVAIFFLAHLSELTSPDVGPAMVEEAALVYVTVSWLLPLIVVAALIFGLRTQHRVQMQPNHPLQRTCRKRPAAERRCWAS
jgi:hypothetical protein